jgi:hypothetical protein
LGFAAEYHPSATTFAKQPDHEPARVQSCALLRDQKSSKYASKKTQLQR